MADLLDGYQRGDSHKRSFFKRMKDNALDQIAEKPLKFTFWATAIGIGGLYLLQQYFIPLEDVAVSKLMDVMGMPMSPSVPAISTSSYEIQQFNDWVQHRVPFSADNIGVNEWWYKPYIPKR